MALPKPQALAHLPALDGLRGLAILLVLPHNLRRITEPFDPASLVWVQLADRGWIGVQLFFVLSGFLITRILLSTREATNYYSGFYARRALRIMPLYYGTLILWLVIRPWFGVGVPHDTSHDRYLWLFLSNWTQPFHPSGGGSGLAHFWSLAVEEQFYLLWPLAIRWLSAPGVLRLCAGLILLSPAIRAGMLVTGWPTEAVYEFTPCRMDALALGGAVAVVLAVPGWSARLLQFQTLIRWSPLTVFLLGAVLSRGFRQTGMLAQTAGYSLLAASFALWILSIAQPARAPEHGWLRSRFLRTAGKYSYGMYVIHYLLGFSWPGQPSVITDLMLVAAGSAVVFPLAVASYHLLESPFLRWKDRFAPVSALPARRSSP